MQRSVGKRSCLLFLLLGSNFFANCALWVYKLRYEIRQFVSSTEIVCSWLCPRGALSCLSKQCPHSKGGGGISVEVCARKEGRKWAPVIFVFIHVAKEVLLAWHSALWNVINGLTERPRNLLVVINPVGGRRKGKDIFDKIVDPLFRRAAIKTTKVQTEYRGHGIRIIQDASKAGILNSYDGIVAVGGDGLVNEVATGLFIVTSLGLGLDPHNQEADLPVTAIRLGIIPSGSTDAACFATHGSSDAVTAAIHIIMGDRRGVDVAAVHSDNQLQRIVTTLMSYGYFGDLLRSSETFRCVGPSRYLLGGFQQIVRNPSYSIKIRIRKDKSTDLGSSCSSVNTSTSCNSICAICSRVEHSSDGSTDDWKEIEGKFSVVSAAITSCACRLTPHGVSPSAHLGDGFTDLILVKGCSRWKLFSYLYHTGVTGHAANLNHVKMIRTNAFEFSASGNSSTWNCDGEQLTSGNLSLRVHRRKLMLFCRGIEEPLKSLVKPLKNSI